jgi:hypothetical protein
MRVEIIGKITRIETIATGRRIRELPRLQRVYGPGRWRKLKGIARVRVEGGQQFDAEVHWYEATGIGRMEFKVKRVLGE